MWPGARGEREPGTVYAPKQSDNSFQGLVWHAEFIEFVLVPPFTKKDMALMVLSSNKRA